MSKISKIFFAMPYFAVAGASPIRERAGNQVLRWYQSNGLNVTPVNRKQETIESIPTVKSISELPNATQTALSIVTPPRVTYKILKEAKKLGIRNIWIQPNGGNKVVAEFVLKNMSSMNVVFGLDILKKGPDLLEECRNEEGHP
ncbi:CoA binding domain-containing protein [Pilaira anomala]|nr:CoA binding domain-containing protein [Pilaira anomala]